MRVTSPFKLIFKKLLCGVTYFGSYKMGTKTEDCDILVLRCISCVEPSKVVMIASKTMVNLRFSVNIML